MKQLFKGFHPYPKISVLVCFLMALGLIVIYVIIGFHLEGYTSTFSKWCVRNVFTASAIGAAMVINVIVSLFYQDKIDFKDE